MPHYYFCLRDDESVADTEGMDLPDLDAARDHASTVARELTFGRDGMLDRDWSRCWRGRTASTTSGSRRLP